MNLTYLQIFMLFTLVGSVAFTLGCFWGGCQSMEDDKFDL